MSLDYKFLEYLEDFVSENRKETYKRVLSQRTNHFTVVLEDLYQKHNWGAVIRSCEVFGIQNLHTIENKYHAHVTNKVGKGSEKWVDLVRFKQKEHNTQDCIDHLKAQGYRIIATTPHNDSQFVADFDVTEKAAFVFGVEKEGVSDMIMDQADGYMKIPMVGFTESLNVSVAAAIILQQTTDKLRRSDVNWQLPQSEQDELYLKWIKSAISSIKMIEERYYTDNENK